MSAPAETITPLPSIDPAVLVKADALLKALLAGAFHETAIDRDGHLMTFSVTRDTCVEFCLDYNEVCIVEADHAEEIAVNLLAFSAYLRSISATEAAKAGKP